MTRHLNRPFTNLFQPAGTILSIETKASGDGGTDLNTKTHAQHVLRPEDLPCGISTAYIPHHKSFGTMWDSIEVETKYTLNEAVA